MLNLKIILQFFWYYCVFDQINGDLVSQRDFTLKIEH